MSLKWKDITLPELRELANKHPAFYRMSCLEDLIDKCNKKWNMNVRVMHALKFHCELNPIELFWAQLKNNFRKINDQSNDSELFMDRIIEVREKYILSDINGRIWSHFCRIVFDFNNI